MTNLINERIISTYEKIFIGPEAHYTSNPNIVTKKANGGERWGTSLSKRGSKKFNIQQHILYGTIGVVLVPLLDGKVKWFAIDVDGDIYHSEALKQNLLNKVKEKAPFLLPCYSKSNGIHFYGFLDEFYNVETIRNFALSLCVLLGIPTDTEIFPKQEKGKVGNGIMTPFMKGYSNKYVYGDIEVFFEHVEENRINLETIKKFTNTQTETKPKEVKETKADVSKFAKDNLTIKDILKKIKIGKDTEPTLGGVYYGWVIRLIAKLVVAKATDEKILKLIKTVHVDGKSYKFPDDYMDWIDYARKDDRLNQPDPQIFRDKFIEDVIYIRKHNRYYNKQFNNTYLDTAINVEYKSIMERKVSPTSYFTEHPNKQIVEDFCYRPDKFNPEDQIINIGNLKYINTFRPVDLDPISGDITPWTELTKHLFPDPKIKTYVDDFISTHVQSPGQKIKFSLLIFSLTFQTGKNTLFKGIRKILGHDNTDEIDIREAIDKARGYLDNQLVLIDELRSENKWNENQKLLNTLKRMITDTYHSQRFLFQDEKKIESCCNFILFSNYSNALPIGDQDPRYTVIKIENEPREEDFYRSVHKFLDSSDGPSYLLHYYKNRKISDGFNPNGRALQTKWAPEMSSEGDHPVTQRVREDYEIKVGPFKNDIVSFMDIESYYKEKGFKITRPNELSNALLSIGGIKKGQAKVEQGYSAYYPTLWVINNHEDYAKMSAKDCAAKYDFIYEPETQTRSAPF